MKPVTTDTTNSNFVKEGCQDLPATIYEHPDPEAPNSHGIETCWELSDEELEQVVKGKRIYVYVRGETIAPMYLSTESLIVFPESEE